MKSTSGWKAKRDNFTSKERGRERRGYSYLRKSDESPRNFKTPREGKGFRVIYTEIKRTAFPLFFRVSANFSIPPMMSDF